MPKSVSAEPRSKSQVLAVAGSRLSRYAIFSQDAFTDPEGDPVRLLYHTGAAALVSLPEPTAEALLTGALDRLGEDDRRRLTELGVIVSTHADETVGVLGTQRAAASSGARRTFALLPTSYCNMGCAYCGQEHSKDAYRGPHRNAVAERVLAAIQAPQVTEVHVGWFGGEPMMALATIRSLAGRFWEAAVAAGTSYTSVMATNGALLDRRKLLVLQNECHLQQLEITLDGPAETHDQHRPLKSGGRSFQRIVDTLAAAACDPLLQDMLFTIRTNVDVANEDNVDEFIDVMVSNGMAHPQISFSIMPIHPWGNDVSKLRLSRETFADREVKWLRRMLANGLNVRLLPDEPVDVVCMAVTLGGEVVNTDGAVFSCTEYPLVPSMREKALIDVSALRPLQSRPAGEFDGWHDELTTGRYPCRDCVFLPVCGGACPKAWHEGNTPCPSYKLNIQGRLSLAAEMNGLNPRGLGENRDA